jgi:hypothetical protein
MLLPAIQYGDWPTVKGRMRKVVTELKRGTDLIEEMTKDGMLDTDDYSGMLVMIRSTLGQVRNFHCFAPWRLAEDPLRDLRTEQTVPSSEEEAVFVASLQTPWGILGLLSSDNQTWLIRRERHQPFLNATLSFWDELDAVGPRYYVVGQGQRLWTLPNNLHYVLANMGVPNDMLRSPLPSEGPRALLRYARPAAKA